MLQYIPQCGEWLLLLQNNMWDGYNQPFRPSITHPTAHIILQYTTHSRLTLLIPSLTKFLASLYQV